MKELLLASVLALAPANHASSVHPNWYRCFYIFNYDKYGLRLADTGFCQAHVMFREDRTPLYWNESPWKPYNAHSYVDTLWPVFARSEK